MHARISRFREDVPDDIGELVRMTEEKIVPQVQALPGFVGMEYLLDRGGETGIAITYWETEEDLRASEQEANRIRQESAELSGGETVDVERYEVVMRVGF